MTDHEPGPPWTLEIGTLGTMRRRLNGLILEGRKCATAGTLADYERLGGPLEVVGERRTLVDDGV